MTLTQRDFDEIEELVKSSVKEEIRNLPTKEEFFGKSDEIMKELKDMREEQSVLTNKVYEDHESRIAKVEKKLQIQSSV